MTRGQINAYLERARAIIGDRSQAEIDYDDVVIAELSSGMDIKSAIAAANLKYPDEALNPGESDWSDIGSRYEYIREHKIILKRLGTKE